MVELDDTVLAPGESPAVDPGVANAETKTVSGPPLGGPAVEPRVPASEAGFDRDGNPTRIGRFLVIRRIGAGGMGVVYAAYDEDLDRKVAVKLLRGDKDLGSAGRARLLREAQALARLNHRNVVSVYEVGTFRDQVFVAMEFVEGRTFKEWQKQPDLHWTEVVDQYLAAGRGLAAAHAVGITHRDFKPDNVMIGDDGRVAVLDFGLARGETKDTDADASTQEADGALDDESIDENASTAKRSDADREPHSSLRASAELPPLTRTGAVMGTPAYMAPEQHRGQPTDARSDQFSFCVSLYEALYGERPFAGETLVALTHSVLEGKVADAPRYTNVPARIRAELLVGLRLEPDRRHTSMDALLSALARSRAPRKPIGAWVLAALAVVLIAVAVLSIRGAPWDPGPERERLEQRRSEALARAREQTLDGAGSTLSQHWDALVLAQARENLDRDPTASLAALAELSPGDRSWLARASIIAADAHARGVARREFEVGRIADLELSPDGRYVAFLQRWPRMGASMADADVKTRAVPALLDIETGVLHLASGDQLLGDIEAGLGQGGPVGLLALSGTTPAKTRVVLRGKDGRLGLWSPLDARFEAIEGLRAGIDAVSAPEGIVLADGKQVEVFDLDLGRVVRRHALEYSPRQVLVLEGASPAVLVLGQQGELVRLLPDGGSEPIPTGGVLARALAVDPLGVGALLEDADGGLHRVVIGAEGCKPIEIDTEGKIRVSGSSGWLVDEGSRIRHIGPRLGAARTLLGHGAPIADLALARSAPIAASVDMLGHMRVWALDDGAPRRIVTRAQPIVELAARDHEVVVGSRTGRVDLINLETDRTTPVAQHTSELRQIAIAGHGEMIATVSREPGVRVWSREHDEAAPTVREVGSVRQVAWSEDGHKLAISSCLPGEHCLLAIDESGETRTLSTDPEPARGLAFSAEADVLAAMWVDEDGRGTVRTWSLVDLDRREHHIDQDLSPPLAFSAGSHGTRIHAATAGGPDTVVLWMWDADGGGEVMRIESGKAAHGRGAWLLTQDDTGEVLLWSLDVDRTYALSSFDDSVEGFLLDPSREQILLRFSEKATIIDLDSGERRPVDIDGGAPAAWGTHLVTGDEQGIQVFAQVAVEDPSQFLRWVRMTTDKRLDVGEFRVSAPKR